MNRGRLRPTLGTVIDLGFVVVVVTIALTTFQSSYGGIDYLVAGALSLLGATIVAFVAARLRWSMLITIVIATAAYVVVASWLALRHYTIAGIVPTPRSVMESFTSSVTGWKELITTAPPVGRTGDLMIVPVFCGYVAGMLSTTNVLRGRWTVATVLPPIVVVGLGIATGTNQPVFPVLHGVVLSALSIGWLAWRVARPREMVVNRTNRGRSMLTGAALLAFVGVVGYLVSPALPGVGTPRQIWRQTVTPPFDPRVYPSPLAGYRDYVKLGYDSNGDPNDDRVMFTVEGLPPGTPIRMATMDSFDGLVWKVSGGDPNEPSLYDSGSFERIGARMPPDVQGETADITVTVRDYSDVWVPDVGEVISIRFEGSDGGAERDRQLADSFRYNRSTDTGATPVALKSGDRYTMTVRLPNSLEDFSDQPVEPLVTRLGTTRSVAELTQKLVTPDVLVINDTGRRLDTIRELMTVNGAYSDGDRIANQIAAKAGHSQARLVEFVQDYPKEPFVGNAEQYAAAYALLFRDLDNLPTRVVMGFVADDGADTEVVEVHQTEVEAWVEVPVEGLGWVAIFPTPPRDQTAVSSAAPQQPEPDYRTQNPPPPPILDPEFDQPAKASGEARASDEVDEEPTPQAEPEPGLLQRPGYRLGLIASSPLLFVVALALVIVTLKWLRRRRRRRRGGYDQRIAAGWREVTDYSTDLGRPVPPTNTRREAAAMVGPVSVALAQRTDASVWGGRELSDADVDAYWAELASTLKSMRSEVGVGKRVRAAVSLRSLKRSVGERVRGRRHG